MQFQTNPGQWPAKYLEGTADFVPLYNKFDATINSSDKSFVVPAGETWRVLWAHIILISTGTVGNRQMEMRILDESSNVMASISAGAVQAASLTREYHYMQGTFRETAFVSTELQTPFPIDLYLPAGWTLNFRDSAAIAAAADDMTVAFQAQRFVGV